MLICRWCGEEYPDDATVDRADDGFWCDNCDGFTHYDPDAAKRHRMLLFLETGGAGAEEHWAGAHEVPVTKKLGKRLSPLRYPGGKSKVIDQIQAQLLREHTDTFVEVFAGGASLGLSLLDAGCVQELVLNDYDPPWSTGSGKRVWRPLMTFVNVLQRACRLLRISGQQKALSRDTRTETTLSQVNYPHLQRWGLEQKSLSPG